MVITFCMKNVAVDKTEFDHSNAALVNKKSFVLQSFDYSVKCLCL
jgi:hypothetical protein